MWNIIDLDAHRRSQDSISNVTWISNECDDSAWLVHTLLSLKKSDNLPESSFTYQWYIALIEQLFWDIASRRILSVYCTHESFQFSMWWEWREIIWFVWSWIIPKNAALIIKKSLEDEWCDIFNIKTIFFDKNNSKISLFLAWRLNNIRITYHPCENAYDFEL